MNNNQYGFTPLRGTRCGYGVEVIEDKGRIAGDFIVLVRLDVKCLTFRLVPKNRKWVESLWLPQKSV
jgi:hypothetical protein